LDYRKARFYSKEKTMVERSDTLQKVLVVPATAGCWDDLEALFGKNGVSAGCWCMFWRLDRASYQKFQGEGNKAVLRSLVLEDHVPGVLAYVDGKAAGWCSVSPREEFAALENSRILIRVDDRPSWAITCFFVAKGFRQQGLARALLEGARDYAISQGAKIVEGYPIDLQAPQLKGQKLTRYSGCMGIASVFRSLGFIEVAHASETQLIMRYYVGGQG
jgi:GNAT superfamily N-acetyltransferase